MTNAIPFDEWLNEQGDNVRIAMCDGHPETLIIVDMTTMHVYKYMLAENQDDTRNIIREFLSKIGPSNAVREFVQHEIQYIHEKQSDFEVTKASELKAENIKLQKLVHGLTWCCEHGECDDRCPLYDRSESDHCREQSLKQVLGIEAS